MSDFIDLILAITLLIRAISQLIANIKRLLDRL